MNLFLTLQRIRNIGTQAHEVASLQLLADVPASMVAVLDAHIAEDGVEVAGGHVKRLGYLRSSERVLGLLVQHADGATYDGVGSVNDFLASELAALRIRRRDVTTRLANLWQHHIGHPALEGLGLWKFGRENQSVKTALVDGCHSGFVGSVANCDGALIFCILSLLVFELVV